MNSTNDIQTIILGGGCFWCTEAVFLSLKGIVAVAPGYAGGHTKNPSYKDICNGNTGHAEVIKIDYDPAVIDVNKILEVFFATHDPTSLNKQGADTGTQYRSVIFYNNEEEKKVFENFINTKQSSGEYLSKIVTSLEPLEQFYPAEDYHKNYYANNPGNMYCSITISPKLKKTFEKFPELIKKD